MKVAILGFGREGRSVLNFLKKSGRARGDEIWILDNNKDLRTPRGIHSKLGKNYLAGLEKFGLIFRSPGIPYNLPELKKARRAGVKFSSATKLFFDEIGTMVRHGSPQVIGVTGTKGKGTTSTLIYKILRAAGKPALLAGNIGKSALDILPQIKKDSVVVLELSSFQLQDLERSPQTAVVLDVFPDHQDAHLNLREYYEAKTNIASHQSIKRQNSDKVFFFKNNQLSRRVAAKSRAKKISVDESRFQLFKQWDLKIKGFHNFKNAAMAASVAADLKIPAKTIIKTVKNFGGLEHRLELVKSVKLKVKSNHQKLYRTIEFYNDSASTNPQTTAAAIKSFPKENKVLIAGGQDKGLDYKPLNGALKNSGTKLVVLFGENKSKIYKAIKNSEVPIRFAANLKEGVALAYKFAKKLPTTYHLLPTVILFSPGATSFDMFRNYADRGEQFKKIVKRLQ